MPIFAVGLNHRTAPAGVREAVAFPLAVQADAVSLIKKDSGAEEVVLVSTRNRSEIYLRGPDRGTLERATACLDQLASRRLPELAPHLYTHSGEAVARHAFRVACGLDSMVVGEPQILGQVKRALLLASASGTLGGHLDRLFQHSFAAARQVRSGTALGELEAEAIIERRVAQFRDWLDARAMVPAIRQMRSAAEHDGEIELARARRRLARGEDPMRVLEALSLGLTNKLLHRPLAALGAATRVECPSLGAAMSSLFVETGSRG